MKKPLIDDIMSLIEIALARILEPGSEKALREVKRPSAGNMTPTSGATGFISGKDKTKSTTAAEAFIDAQIEAYA